MMKQRKLRIAIIGAGASGIMAAVKLRETGIDDVVIFEKAGDLGGTWRENRYPGITCDVPSHAYRFSFAPNPDWSHVCSAGEEIQAYMRKTAQQFGVDRLVRYNEEVLSAQFTSNAWHIKTTSGDQGAFDTVITATGVLHHPVYPDIPDRETFRGKCFHSARWDDGVSLKDKRVGIIGTGSTAIQIVGAVIDDVRDLYLFQRTAQWIWPLPNTAIPEDKKEMYRQDPEFLQSEYIRLTTRMNDNFAAAVVGENPEAYNLLEQECQENLDTVKDPNLKALLTPDYKVGCKRLIMSDTFYDAIQKPNAHLVTNPISRFCQRGLQMRDGTIHDLDVIVLATGFDTHRFFRPMKVVGPTGRTIEEAWSERNQSYLTVAVPEFPNWFMIGGPSSPIGNFSWLLTAETQFQYILQLIKKLETGEANSICPKPEPTKRFNDEIRERLPKTIWMTGCSSWYFDKNGDVASWPWTFDKFVDDMKEPQWADYTIN